MSYSELFVFLVLDIWSSQIHEKGKTMADQREKAIDKGHKPQPRVPGVEDELSDTYLEKVSGGAGADADEGQEKKSDEPAK
jgi:hypothetical protein